MSTSTFAKASIFVGTKLYPQGPGPAPQLADYTGDTYTQLSHVTSVGDFGDTAEPVKVMTISDARSYTMNGAASGGDMALECLFDGSDAGQALLQAARANGGNVNFKVQFADPVTLGTGTGTIAYFRGVVNGCQLKSGTANSAVMLVSKIGINSAATFVPAT